VTIDTTGRYLQPAGAKWNLLLVNDWNPMPANWEANMTKTVINASAQNGSVDSRIAEPLQEMIAACRAAGGTIWAQSMHRPYDIQEALFERAVNRYLAQGYSRERAEAIANTEVKRPGYSEHNTGLAVDFNSCSHDFTGTVAHQWLVKHCAEYGFILRFPEGKEEVTGVMYESWHYRYVGKEAAKEIMSEGITLEEYCERYGL
jgi:D-alanyl-D-alanine carboxypeptidase